MRNNYTLTYILFVVAQMILCNFFHFTPYVTLTLLPMLVFFIPVSVSTTAAMLIAFATGLAVDFFAEGLLGINALSLVPVAFLRRPLIEMTCGQEPFEQNENISLKKYGFGRISMALILEIAVFLTIYILAECAGTRPLWFIGARLGLSVLASYLVSILFVNLLTYDDRR
ncbi:MAG: hypothetical protein II029_00170 [Bacteroidales bacterium]|nr:hypothetical protein [Bacteroidales bacterium]